MKAVNTIQKLQSWYAAQCNGHWEHDQAISIESCDNPGWWVKINLKGTRVQGKPFESKSLNVSSDLHATDVDWLHCHVDNDIWNGAGDATKLEEILEIFLAWVN